MGILLQSKMKKIKTTFHEKSHKSQTVKIEAEKFIQTPKHPRERKKFIENRMAKKNSNAVLSKTFDFDPQE